MKQDQELFDEIIWVMQHYGSDAGEKHEPGSKLRAQANRIVEFVSQRQRAWELLDENDLSLVRVTRYHTA